jgi:hypothetical protein
MSAANTILLVGKFSHARAEWEALGSLAQLKVENTSTTTAQLLFLVSANSG